MLFRANAELYPNLSLALPPHSLENLTINLPDFSLVNRLPDTAYLGSNLPALLTSGLRQDLLTDHNLLEAERGTGLTNDVDAPAWDSLWHGAVRLPITAVPEPSALALLIGGAVLAGASRLRSRQ